MIRVNLVTPKAVAKLLYGIKPASDFCPNKVASTVNIYAVSYCYTNGYYADCRYAECRYAECRYAERLVSKFNVLPYRRSPIFDSDIIFGGLIL